jgi:hypothetical protein
LKLRIREKQIIKKLWAFFLDDGLKEGFPFFGFEFKKGVCSG